MKVFRIRARVEWFVAAKSEKAAKQLVVDACAARTNGERLTDEDEVGAYEVRRVAAVKYNGLALMDKPCPLGDQTRTVRQILTECERHDEEVRQKIEGLLQKRFPTAKVEDYRDCWAGVYWVKKLTSEDEATECREYLEKCFVPVLRRAGVSTPVTFQLVTVG